MIFWRTYLILAFLQVIACLQIGSGVYDALDHIQTRMSTVEQAETVQALIQRLLPYRAEEFYIQVNADLGPQDRDTFRVEKVAGMKRVNITGSSGLAAAWGFHHYLKYYCSAHVSWEADQLHLPTQLPVVQIQITSNDRFRYYQNVCTVSYSSVWWNWSRWEREIDWMAMNGINLPLAFTGQEAIWQRVYLRLGLTQAELDQHFVGPAFLAWGRMGNIQKWGAPLPQEWHQRTLLLQHRILKRMRQFGMTPILPAFSGHVPRSITRIFPSASVTKLPAWGHFNDTYTRIYLLEPTDPLFLKIGSAFMKELQFEFGTNHVYNCDIFNEMRPSSGNPTYLAQFGRAVYQSMVLEDPKAVWLMQGWIFAHDPVFWNTARAKALVTSVPLGHMIILDLQAELWPQYIRLKSYFGQPFIWCMLHNYGGTLGLYGAFMKVNAGVFKGRLFPNSTMIGTGITPEGINQNYIMYDFMNEMGWRTTEVNLDDWVEMYSVRRYGKHNPAAVIAWKLMKKSVYNSTTSFRFHGKHIITRRPDFNLKPLLWYNVSDLYRAWDNILYAAPEFGEVGTFQHDLVDITRQVLQVMAIHWYTLFIGYYRHNNLSLFKNYSKLFLNLLDDMDTILASRDAFLLGVWLQTARSWSNTEKDQHHYEYNARNQITLWGPRGEILDYATKQWAGVVSHYYKPRWILFIKTLEHCLTEKVKFNKTQFDIEVFQEVEAPFTFDQHVYPSNATGNPVKIAQLIHRKWHPYFTHNMKKAMSIYKKQGEHYLKKQEQEVWQGTGTINVW